MTSLIADVKAVMERLRHATASDVHCELLGERAGLDQCSVSQALRRLQLDGVLRREKLPRRKNGAYLYHLASDWTPPCVGERYIDAIDRYLSNVE